MALFRTSTYVDHVPGSPEETFTIDSGKCVRVYQTSWANRITTAQDFLGHSELVIDGSIRHVRRVTPHAHPDAPWLRARSVARIEGVGFMGKDSTTHVPTYDTARLMVIYEAPSFNVREDQEVEAPLGPLTGYPDEGYWLGVQGWGLSRYVTKHIRPGGRVLVLSPGLCRGFLPNGGGWAAVGILPDGIPFYEPYQDITYTWHDVPLDAVPVNAIMAIQGHVNSEEFDGHPAQTLLCQSPDLVPRTSPFGVRTVDIQYHFRFLPNWDESETPPVARGHNWIRKFIAAQGMRWIRVDTRADGGGSPPYLTADFQKLFRPDQP